VERERQRGWRGCTEKTNAKREGGGTATECPYLFYFFDPREGEETREREMRRGKGRNRERSSRRLNDDGDGRRNGLALLEPSGRRRTTLLAGRESLDAATLAAVRALVVAVEFVTGLAGDWEGEKVSIQREGRQKEEKTHRQSILPTRK
jgi:hypothetical protein